jgi:hypothetical protein
MPKEAKVAFLEQLERRLGKIEKLPNSLSLYDVGKGAARIYVRYSKLHQRNQAFYGLRQKDLQRLEGHAAFICLLWDAQREPLILPFADYEDIIQQLRPAEDGQFKCAVFVQTDGSEFYMANAGRFNIEAYFGWTGLEIGIDRSKLKKVDELTHAQVQTFLGAIGEKKGYDIWIPANNRSKMDWSLTKQFRFHKKLPYNFKEIENIIEEIDVIWTQRGSAILKGLFEIEHSTPIYSGLLRFNDVHLVAPDVQPRFSIVAREDRRTLFVRLLNRPTFRTSGLNEHCTFLEYGNLAAWHARTCSKTKTNHETELV